jgi:hypothetical protein
MVLAPDAWRGCDIIVFSRTSADALDRYEDSEPEELASDESEEEEEEEEEEVEEGGEEEEIESTVFLFLYLILLHRVRLQAFVSCAKISIAKYRPS